MMIKSIVNNESERKDLVEERKCLRKYLKAVLEEKRNEKRTKNANHTKNQN